MANLLDDVNIRAQIILSFLVHGLRLHMYHRIYICQMLQLLKTLHLVCLNI